jgi:hypothetical protein
MVERLLERKRNVSGDRSSESLFLPPHLYLNREGAT